MPQLVKGAKWCFGWAVVTPMLRLVIPPDAWVEYGFQSGEKALFLPGSKRSGGYGLSSVQLFSGYSDSMSHVLLERLLAEGCFGNGVVFLPPELQLKPGKRLLVVRGSGRALGLLTKGPIYEEACKHPELEIFDETLLPADERS